MPKSFYSSLNEPPFYKLLFKMSVKTINLYIFTNFSQKFKDNLKRSDSWQFLKKPNNSKFKYLINYS
jgi:hypothetical protein